MKNIMIIMPIDPYSITVYGSQLMSKYFDQADIFSIQTLALLDSNTADKDTDKFYPVQNVLFAQIAKEQPHLMLAKNRSFDYLFVLGNCDKSTVKWDHIVTCEEWWDETKQDNYINESNKVFSEVSIDWFTYKDAEYSFPTWKHLQLFLKTLGVEANDKV